MPTANGNLETWTHSPTLSSLSNKFQGLYRYPHLFSVALRIPTINNLQYCLFPSNVLHTHTSDTYEKKKIFCDKHLLLLYRHWFTETIQQQFFSFLISEILELYLNVTIKFCQLMKNDNKTTWQ